MAFLQQNLLVFTTGLAVLCTLLGAGRIVYHEHKAAQLRDLGRYLVTYVLVSGAAAGAASVLIGGCDQMASWFITRASASSRVRRSSRECLLGLADGGNESGGRGSGRVHGRAGGDGHDGVHRDRAGDHRVPRDGDPDHADARPRRDAGAAGGDAAAGRRVLEHRDGDAVVPQGLAWLLAFALYKPAAAIVYAVAFDLAGQPGALALLDGVMMLVLAILALPALLRFVVPATSALAGGGRCRSDARRRSGRGDRDADADRRRTASPRCPPAPTGKAQGGGPSGAALAGGGPAQRARTAAARPARRGRTAAAASRKRRGLRATPAARRVSGPG